VVRRYAFFDSSDEEGQKTQNELKPERKTEPSLESRKDDLRGEELVRVTYRQSITMENKESIQVRMWQSVDDLTRGSKMNPTVLRAFSKYGATYFLVHFGSGFFFLVGWFVLLSSGVDLTPAFDYIGLPQGLETAGTMGVAIAAHKLTSPIRLGLSMILTPPVVHIAQSMGYDPMKWLLPVPGLYAKRKDVYREDTSEKGDEEQPGKSE